MASSSLISLLLIGFFLSMHIAMCNAVSVEDCGGSGKKIYLGPSGVKISPDKLSFPGPVHIQYDVVIADNITSPIEAHLKLRRRIWGFRIPIPTCDVDNICVYASNKCPISRYFVVKCPIVKQHHAGKESANLPSISVLKHFAKGHYELTVRLTEKKTRREVACFFAKFDMK